MNIKGLKVDIKKLLLGIVGIAAAAYVGGLLLRFAWEMSPQVTVIVVVGGAIKATKSFFVRRRAAARASANATYLVAKRAEERAAAMRKVEEDKGQGDFTEAIRMIKGWNNKGGAV